MISIYTYLLIITTLALLACVAGSGKIHYIPGAGLPALMCAGAYPTTGTSSLHSQMRHALRYSLAAAMPDFAQVNSFTRDMPNHLPASIAPSKELIATQSPVGYSRKSLRDYLYSCR